METIEEAVREYQREVDIVKVDSISQLSTSIGESYQAPISFKQGIEFAQRWILVEEELPPKCVDIIEEFDFSDDVIVKTVTGSFCTGHYSYLNNRWESNAIEDVIIDDVIGWRPIEYK